MLHLINYTNSDLYEDYYTFRKHNEIDHYDLYTIKNNEITRIQHYYKNSQGVWDFDDITSSAVPSNLAWEIVPLSYTPEGDDHSSPLIDDSKAIVDQNNNGAQSSNKHWYNKLGDDVKYLYDVGTGNLKGGYQGLVDDTKQVINKGEGKVKDEEKKVKDKINSWEDDIKDDINKIEDIGNNIKDSVENTYNKVKNDIQSGIDWADDKFNSFEDKVKHFFDVEPMTGPNPVGYLDFVLSFVLTFGLEKAKGTEIFRSSILALCSASSIYGSRLITNSYLDDKTSVVNSEWYSILTAGLIYSGLDWLIFKHFSYISTIENICISTVSTYIQTWVDSIGEDSWLFQWLGVTKREKENVVLFIALLLILTMYILPKLLVLV